MATQPVPDWCELGATVYIRWRTHTWASDYELTPATVTRVTPATVTVTANGSATTQRFRMPRAPRSPIPRSDDRELLPADDPYVVAVLKKKRRYKIGAAVEKIGAKLQRQSVELDPTAYVALLRQAADLISRALQENSDTPVPSEENERTT